MSGDASLCHRCGRVTRWLPIRGGRLRCEGCGDTFPCRYANASSGKCKHVDCASARGEASPLEGVHEVAP